MTLMVSECFFNKVLSEPLVKMALRKPIFCYRTAGNFHKNCYFCNTDFCCVSGKLLFDRFLTPPFRVEPPKWWNALKEGINKIAQGDKGKHTQRWIQILAVNWHTSGQDFIVQLGSKPTYNTVENEFRFGEWGLGRWGMEYVSVWSVLSFLSHTKRPKHLNASLSFARCVVSLFLYILK